LEIGRKEVLLTFDVEGPPLREDFLNKEIIIVLSKVLKLLKKYSAKGLFFITGTVAEQIRRYPKILELLKAHEIGYHASSHSLKPAIFEYTDTESYGKAVEISRKRETSSIDPLSGNIRGKGGILSLRQIFPEKEIVSFRAPFFCWSPPHVEALRDLEFRFDFSADISNVPVLHKGVTFFPYPIMIDSPVANFPVIAKKILSQDFCILLMHPSHLMFKPDKLFYYQYNNPFHPVRIRKRFSTQVTAKFLELETFFFILNLLRRKGLIKLTNRVERAENILDPQEIDVAKVYNKSLHAAKKLFGYKPKYLPSHFYNFIEG